MVGRLVGCPPSSSPPLSFCSAFLLPFLRIVRRISFGVAAASVAEPLARSLAQVPRCLGESRRRPRPSARRLQVHLECGDLLLHLHLAVSQSRSRSQLGQIHRSDFTVALSFAQASNRNSFVSGFEPLQSSLPVSLFLDGSLPLALKRNVAAMVLDGRAVFLNIVKTTISVVRRRASTVSLNVDYPASFPSFS